MRNYLSIIRKLDLIDLFKFGSFRVNYAVPFDGHLDNHIDDEVLFNQLTSRMNMYEYSFEYLMIHFVMDGSAEQDICIDVRNVCALYAFDEQAKKEMSISFDSRIQFCVSPWADRFANLQQNLSKKQSLRGIDNLWSIFDLPMDDRLKCDEIIGSQVVEEVFREFYSNERPSGDLSIWVYLLRYERHAFYQKGTLGFFCDFIHVYCNYMKKSELDGEVAQTTSLYKALVSSNNRNFIGYCTIVERSPLAELTEQVSGCKFYVVAPLFLCFVSRYADGMNIKPDDEYITHAKKKFGFECSLAVYLLGMILGYDKTYDAFYDFVQLRLFKKRIPDEESIGINGDLFATRSTAPCDNKVYSVEGGVAALKRVDSALGEGSSKYMVNSDDSSLNTQLPMGQGLDEQDSLLKSNEFTMSNKTDSWSEQCSVTSDNASTIEWTNPNVNNASTINGQETFLWMRKKGQKGDIKRTYSLDEYKSLVNLGYQPVRQFNKCICNHLNALGCMVDVEKKRHKENIDKVKHLS